MGSTSSSFQDDFSIEYAYQLQLEEALEASRILHLQNSSASDAPVQLKPQVNCSICLESRNSDLFCLSECSHSFCRECILTYAQLKIKSRTLPVPCPQSDCTKGLSNAECWQLFDPDTLKLYVRIQAEMSISESERVYCPFPDCSALMVMDSNQDSSYLQIHQDKGKEPIYNPKARRKRRPRGANGGAQSSKLAEGSMSGGVECMECHRLFCFDCKVPWHADMTCTEYQNLPSDMRSNDDKKLLNLAKLNKWRRCDKCKAMVELVFGCYHIYCRCGHQFCYICGLEWKERKATCNCLIWDNYNRRLTYQNNNT